MAIQGIIRGFANPANLAQNIIIVGRGAHYVLIIDGAAQEPNYPNLDDAVSAFEAKAAVCCTPAWLEVAELVTGNVGGISVTRLDTFAYEPPGTNS